tara:strand:+ start:3296 stop:3919 length:624 start_codon:yes stop_codon:yes gene_type:complete
MIPDNPQNKSYKDLIKSNLKIIIIIIIIIALAGITYLIFDINNKNKKIKISERFIEAKILINEGDYKDSLVILDNLIMEKDNIYSPLSLFLIIDRNLEQDSKTLIKYFDSVLSIKKIDKEDLNLLKLKKAIFISESSKEKELLDLLNPIINSSSIWKFDSIKFLGDYYFSMREFKKAEQYYTILLAEENLDIDKDDLKRKMKLIINE